MYTMVFSRLTSIVLSHTKKQHREISLPQDQKSVASTPPRPHLTTLPTEILQHIATLLPLEPEATLPLTCHHMKEVLGMRSWSQLSRNLRGNEKHIRSGRWLFLPGALENLLVLLARDMEPETAVVCFHHLIIHRRRKLPRAFARSERSTCKLRARELAELESEQRHNRAMHEMQDHFFTCDGQFQSFNVATRWPKTRYRRPGGWECKLYRRFLH